MLVYDASSGVEAKRIKLSDLGEPDVLLGGGDTGGEIEPEIEEDE